MNLASAGKFLGKLVAFGLSAFIAFYFALPAIVKRLNDAASEYRKSREAVEKSVDFWATQNETFRKRMEADLEERQKFYSNIIVRQDRDIRISTEAVDNSANARRSQRLGEEAFDEALDAFDAFITMMKGSQDSHRVSLSVPDEQLLKAANEYVDKLIDWKNLLRSLDDKVPMSGQYTYVARLTENRMFQMINTKLDYLGHIEHGPARIKLCGEIESLLSEYDQCFVVRAEATSPSFAPGDISNISLLAANLCESNAISECIFKKLNYETRRALDRYQKKPEIDPDSFRMNLAADLEKIISGPPLSAIVIFPQERLREETMGLLRWSTNLYDTGTGQPGYGQSKRQDDPDRQFITRLLNRALLEDAFPDAIAAKPASPSQFILLPGAYPPNLAVSQIRRYEVEKCRCYLSYLRAKYYLRLGRYEEALNAASESEDYDPDRRPMTSRMLYATGVLKIATLEAQISRDVHERSTNDLGNLVMYIADIHADLHNFYRTNSDKTDALYLDLLMDYNEWNVFGTNKECKDWADARRTYTDFTNTYNDPGKFDAKERGMWANLKAQADVGFKCLEAIHQGYTTDPLKEEDEPYTAAEIKIINDLCTASLLFKSNAPNWSDSVEDAKKLLDAEKYNPRVGLPVGILLRLEGDIDSLRKPVAKYAKNPWLAFSNRQQRYLATNKAN